MKNMKQNSKLIHIAILLLITLYLPITVITHSQSDFRVTKLVLEALKNPKSDFNFVDKGKMNGCITDDEFWDVYLHLREAFPFYVGKVERIGQSYEGRHMHGFFFGNEEDKKGVMKNIILFTALHHSRECVTINMILTIFVEQLKSLLNSDKRTVEFFSNNRFL